jgi:hypothetical protein
MSRLSELLSALMRAAFYSTLFLAVAVSGHANETAVPTSYPAERYASMREKSPFALATPAAAPAAPKQAPFTQNLVLGGLGVVLDQGEEKIWASIKDRDKKEQFDLYGNQPNTDGISIASVEKSAVSAKTKVMLRKGDEYGTVEYDAAAFAPAAAEQPAVPAGRQQPRMGGPAGAVNQPRASANRIQIPRPNVAPQANVAPAPEIQTPGAPQPAPTARRVRVITSRP